MKNVGILIEKLKQGEEIYRKHYNPYVEKALELQDVLFSPQDVREKLVPLLQEKSKPLIVEVGCYLGKNLLEFAQDVPEAFFIGIDITYKRCVKAALKIKNHHCDNALVCIMDARDFFQTLPDYFLDGVCVFFPDPWPKKRHVKNRLITENFLKVLATKIKPHGFFWFKTDYAGYAEEVDQFYSAKNGWHLHDANQPPFFNKREYVTIFEKIFLDQNLPVFRRVWIQHDFSRDFENKREC